MANQIDFDILMIGFDSALKDKLQSSLDEVKLKHLKTSADVEAFLESYELTAGTPVLVSNQIEGMTHFEVGQALSSYFQGLRVVFITQDRSNFEVSNLKKNGFVESYLLPMDQGLLSDFLDEIKRSKPGGCFRKYKAVKLVDVQPGEDLPFEVHLFLPLNKKYVVLTGSGKLSEKKHAVLQQKNINSVFVDSEQLDQFYEFAAEQLLKSESATNDNVSQTEKSEKFQHSIRELFRSILDASTATGDDYQNGRDLLEQSKKVVETYIEKKTGLELKNKLNSLIGEGRDSYSHAQVVSTISCLLSMATGIGQPEDLAIAGLFHDIGIYGPHEDISIFDLEQLSEEDREHYKQHPKRSLNLLKEKKITVTPIVSEIIEKHHERTDGNGYPGKLPAHKVPQEAQLLAYADAFEHLTRQQPGIPTPSPQEVHKIVMEKMGLSPEVTVKIGKFLNEITPQQQPQEA